MESLTKVKVLGHQLEHFRLSISHRRDVGGLPLALTPKTRRHKMYPEAIRARTQQVLTKIPFNAVSFYVNSVVALYGNTLDISILVGRETLLEGLVYFGGPA